MTHDPYSTHLPLLLKAVRATSGNILELGMGSGSTPALHDLCAEQRRRLVSYDNDPKYAEANAKFRSPLHEIHLVTDWDHADIERPWSVALVDHRPARRRWRDTLRLASYAEYIVVHDTEPEIDRFYKFSRVFPKFKFVFHSGEIPRTTVLSLTKDVSWMAE